MMTKIVNQYHSGASKNIKMGFTGPHFGIELELVANAVDFCLEEMDAPVVEKSGGYFEDVFLSGFANYLEGVFNQHGFPENCYLFEKDGSLISHESYEDCGTENGIEVIFQPMNLNVILALDWVGLFDTLRSKKWMLLGNRRAGLHIHLGRYALSNTSYNNLRALWIDALYMPEDFRLKMFGRKSNAYCSGLDCKLEYSPYDLGDDNYDEDDVYAFDHFDYPRDAVVSVPNGYSYFDEIVRTSRYVPLNLTREDTIESRMFASPTMGGQILRAVDYVKKLYADDVLESLHLPENYSQKEFYATLQKYTLLGRHGWCDN
ncbi:amidoligase family protein [Acidithiobacillus sp. M4-SHS-6]|uniref:amidoligase family protein n=1 Tax=Acidithiobacillus sp. M4-SHS-6 TaxID=3383024 RepID=UPI0039BE8201